LFQDQEVDLVHLEFVVFRRTYCNQGNDWKSQGNIIGGCGWVEARDGIEQGFADPALSVLGSAPSLTTRNRPGNETSVPRHLSIQRNNREPRFFSFQFHQIPPPKELIKGFVKNRGLKTDSN
jgi:hypothetical protein